jgi:hypothetical protein
VNSRSGPRKASIASKNSSAVRKSSVMVRFLGLMMLWFYKTGFGLSTPLNPIWELHFDELQLPPTLIVSSLSQFLMALGILFVDFFDIHSPNHLDDGFFPLVFGLGVFFCNPQFSGHIAFTIITGEVTTSGWVSHSFFPFLSFLLIDIIADGLEAVNPCFQIFSKIHSCSTTEQCSPQQGQMP